jgi:NADH dehydrogenase FAD-containing subunit
MEIAVEGDDGNLNGRARVRIVVLGGGFGGVTTARHLERRLRGYPNVEITLISRDNFFVLTPLLFESCSGRLELRHCAQPIRAALRRTRFLEAAVQAVDVQRQMVRAVIPDTDIHHDLPYDHLVVALGASTNEQLIPGSSHALTFKTMADALVLRNRLIEQFERADATAASSTRRGCLTVVIIGGGLVGVELLGELTAFADDVLRFYPRIRRSEIRFLLCEAGARVLPEVDEQLAIDARRLLEQRGAEIRWCAPLRPVVCTSPPRPSQPRRSCWRPASCQMLSRQPFLSFTISAAALPWTRRCGAAVIRTCGRSATARQSLFRVAAPTQRLRSTPSVRRNTLRRTSTR